MGKRTWRPCTIDNMTSADIITQRLYSQHLLEKLDTPSNVVRSFGAVQAQDFAGAKWALGLRSNTTDAGIAADFNEGKILRTHALRPTWHFVAPEDIRWILELTGPRVHAFNKYYYKKTGGDEATMKKASGILQKALQGGKQLMRTELADALEIGGISDPKGLRLIYILMYAELEGLICSGALRGKQHTYALIDERAPQAKSLPHDEALAELTRRYFTSHGPAQIQDFAWWSSLTIAEIKRGIEIVGLKSQEVDGKTYYFTDQAEARVLSPLVHLLPIYDEYFVAYKDREIFSQSRTFKLLREPTYEDLSYQIVTLDGQLAGGWKRKATAKQLTVELNMFAHFNASQAEALDQAANGLKEFIGLPVVMT